MASLVNMWPGRARPRYRGVLGLWLAFVAVPGAAQVSPLNTQTLFYHQARNYGGGNYLALDGGALWTNNALHTAGGSSDTVLLLGLSGEVSGGGGRFDYRLSSNLALAKYLSGNFPTRPVGFLDGLATLKIVPGFFTWIARETYAQVQINVYAPASPQNLVNMNTITTGPRFTMRPTLRTSVQLDALYSYLSTSSYSYSNPSSGSSVFTNFDNHRYGGSLTIDRAFSEMASLYLKGEYEKVEFKDQVNNHNFSIGTAEGGYKLSDARTVFDVSGGYSRLRVYDVPGTVDSVAGERETLQTEEVEEPTWKLVLSRAITPNQRLGLSASQGFVDAAAAVQANFEAPATAAPALLASGNPYLQRHFGVNWHIHGVRTAFNISLYKSSNRYLLTNVNVGSNANVGDYDSKGVNALLTRELSPVLKWDIGVDFEHTNQTSTPAPGVPAQSATAHGAITNLQWQVGQHVSLRFIYAQFNRPSNSILVPRRV